MNTKFLLNVAAALTIAAVFSFAAKAAEPIQPFNGKDLDNWQVKGDKAKSKWKVGVAQVSPDDPKQLIAKEGEGEMINLAAKHGDSLDIHTKDKFGDVHLEVEVMVPQGSNSGIYLMGEYELQVLDSYGKPNDKLSQGDMGAVYSAAAPKLNASKKPGEWQKYVIDFQAPRFSADGKKTTNAKFIKVELNGQVVQENLEVAKGSTGGGVTGKEAATGPLMFQGNHGAVAFRNIKITPSESK
ncbi:MAG: DUF1080 domain-containing protein [Candidatus Sumerlaeota bacterium]|nr:DUF1080 domain-containing protein [Candidatus Sumerlaeota bacterium]